MYEQQLDGPPKLEPNDYICINEKKNIYGRVRVWGNEIIKFTMILFIMMV